MGVFKMLSNSDRFVKTCRFRSWGRLYKPAALRLRNPKQRIPSRLRISYRSLDATLPPFTLLLPQDRVTIEEDTPKFIPVLLLQSWASWGEAARMSLEGKVHPAISASLSVRNGHLINIDLSQLRKVVEVCDQIIICGPEDILILDKINGISGGSLLSAVLHAADSVRVVHCHCSLFR